MNNFYVYVYMDPSRPGAFNYGEYFFPFEPFYVGKGQGLRCYYHLKEAAGEYKVKKNSHKYNKIRKILSNKLSPVISKVKEDLTNEEAATLETQLINIIGRRTQSGPGPLTNVHDGGNGGAQPFEIRKQISEALKKYYETHNGPNKGRILSEETKQKISTTHTGLMRDKDSVQKQIETRQQVAQEKGFYHSEDTKQKIRKHHNTVQHKQKMAATTEASWQDEESRQKRIEGIKQAYKEKRAQGIKHMWITDGTRSGCYEEKKALELIEQGWRCGRILSKHRLEEPTN
jgi:hypothetical protein